MLDNGLMQLLKFRPFGCLLFAVLLVPALTGCDRAMVSGRVFTIDGETLPGVAVSVEGESGMEALSNALGEYRLVPPVGTHALRFSKSGYAPAVSTVTVAARETVTLEDVSMWRLPRNKGVFIYESARFIETTPAESRTFLLEGDVAEYAIRAEVEARTERANPVILCYHMPRYEARLTRLRTATAQLKKEQEYTFEVLAGAGTIPVRMVPVDQPEGLLMQAVFDDALDPGAYALHWGALTGDTVLEPRAYLFAVGALHVEAPPAPIEGQLPESGESNQSSEIPDAEASITDDVNTEN